MVALGTLIFRHGTKAAVALFRWSLQHGSLGFAPLRRRWCLASKPTGSSGLPTVSDVAREDGMTCR